MRRVTQWLAVLVLLASILPLAPAAFAKSNEGPAPIRLKATTFVPALGLQPQVPESLTVAPEDVGAIGDYIIQFTGPVQEAWKDALSAMGAQILDYIPEYAFKVRLPSNLVNQLQALDEVAWIGPFQPAYKLSSTLVIDGPRLYRVSLVQGADLPAAAVRVAAQASQVVRNSGEYLVVAATPEQVKDLAFLLDVAYIENFELMEKHNEYGGGAILGAGTANANGYDGSTQIAAVADTGIGGGTANTAHPDVPANRIVTIRDWPGADSSGCQDVIPDGAQDVESGHGTHTALSAVGGGGASGEGRAPAPAARLVFQAVEDYVDFVSFCSWFYQDGYYLVGLPDDFGDLFQQAYNDGARIHSNSWGSSVAGEYTQDSANTDGFIWNHPDMTITFSAGNAGVDNNNNGVVDSDSIGSPATGKNVITVGASENDRQGHWECDTGVGYTSRDSYQSGQTCGSMGGQNILGTAGQRWGFTAEPLNSDITAGNAQQMAPFSSRGPTDDGRIKPDVVAPGTWVLSGYSILYQEGYGDPVNPRNGAYQSDGWGMPVNANYKYFGGTSMSNPLTAGAATVVRDFYQKAYGHGASAALVKATLINSAVDLMDENNDGANDNDFPIPNDHEGWGRVNLVNATDGSHQYVDEPAGLNTSGTQTFQYNVGASGAPFKVSLVWSDYPASTAAAKALVNDLDLVVTAPGGATYRGNVFSGGWSQAGGSADRTNNVENVYVQSAAAGTWTVQVSGFNVPSGPQPFALVVDGNFSSTPVDNPPTVTITNPGDGTTVSGTVDVTATASDDNGVTQVEFFVDGGSIGTDTDGINGWSIPWDTATAGDGAHTVSATATDTIGQTDSDSNSVTVDNVNDPPVASFTYTCSGLSCNFDASGSNDPDGTIAGYDWNFGDSSTDSGVTTSHTYAAAGTYGVVLTVTDNRGASDTDTQSVTVQEVVVLTVHLGNLQGSSASGPRNRWDATVIVTVHDSNHALVGGAQVQGAWSLGASGSGSCMTNASGTCSITKTGIKNNTSGVTFTVNSVASSVGDYRASDNHSGNSIRVLRPN